jgi:hypothetical protein
MLTFIISFTSNFTYSLFGSQTVNLESPTELTCDPINKLGYHPRRCGKSTRKHSVVETRNDLPRHQFTVKIKGSGNGWKSNWTLNVISPIKELEALRTNC